MTLTKIYITNELNNKSFTKVLIKNSKFLLVNNFKFTDIKVIKNIISLELFCAVRPKLAAVVWRKTLLCQLKTNCSLLNLSYLQRTPIVWSRYLMSTVNLTSNFFAASCQVKNNPLSIQICSKKAITKQEIYVKSAYFD